MKPYDETSELTEYLWQHHLELFSEAERKALWAVFAERKSTGGSNGIKARIWEQHRLADDPAVMQHLSEGTEAFYRRAAQRVFAEHAEISVNRCPACHRIVRTPKAKQCFWCGNDSHLRVLNDQDAIDP
jgi:hypothetical protein